ncbi:MAG: 1,6-anhydro-N-acetylmuramyl-L-alanine amidase AmpD [Zoogloea sp.]|uniref:1,6-anhydro-N-acetylmuramyl-L-alanine amidase AmpD n=1 Tax=Zoogloea sp. TaxID=49181 RepID=UPI003F3734BC
MKYISSPNHDTRPQGERVRLVVIHAISLPPNCFGGDGVEQLFTNRLNPDEHPFYREIHTLRVSAHYFIRRDGAVICFVPPELRAWHAGVSCWQGQERCNDFSIGIELEGCDTQPFEPEQYEALAELLQRLVTSFPIADVVGHSHVAPGRKTDPGPHFDWTYLALVLEQKGGLQGVCLTENGPESIV